MIEGRERRGRVSEEGVLFVDEISARRFGSIVLVGVVVTAEQSICDDISSSGYIPPNLCIVREIYHLLFDIDIDCIAFARDAYIIGRTQDSGVKQRSPV